MRAGGHAHADQAGRRRFADAVVAALAGAGARALFGAPAESLDPLLDAVRRDGRASSSTCGTRARARSWRPPTASSPESRVCVGAGPGATHLPLGVYEARADSAPLLALSGQVPAEQIGLGSFKEIDPVALMAGGALDHHHIGTPHQIGVVHRALPEAGLRCGPVHLSCSSDVFAAPAGPPVQIRAGRPGAGSTADKATLTAVAERVCEPGTAVVVGAVPAGLAASVEGLAERVGAPVLVLPEGYRYFAAIPKGRAVPVLDARAREHAELLARCARVLVVGPAGASVERLVTGRPVVQVADGTEGAHPCPAGWDRLLGDPDAILRQLAALAVPGRDGELCAAADRLRGDASPGCCPPKCRQGSCCRTRRTSTGRPCGSRGAAAQ